MSVARRKRIKRFVLDTNVWISYCLNGELEWLARYIVQNRLIIYGSPSLLSEIKKVFNYPKIKRLLTHTPTFYLDIIQALILLREDLEVAVHSPDPNDDYLFALAIHTNVKAMVCGDKKLLNWNASPVKLLSKKQFEELY